MRRVLLCTGASFCLLTSVVGAAAQGGPTVFELDFLMQYDRLAPDPYPNITNRVRMSVTLSGTKSVDLGVSRNVARLSDYRQIQSRLGPSGERAVWRVVDASTLRGTVNFPASVRTITLVTTGGNTCAVQVEDRLKPGQNVYRFKRLDNGTLGNFSQPRITSSSCTVR